MRAPTNGEAQDLLTAYKLGWESGTPDRIIELLDRDIDYRADPFSEPLIGSNAVRALWNDIAAAQTHVEFDAERVWVSGATILASWHAAHTRRATAERVRVRGFMTLELGDHGLVKRVRQWPVERVVGSDGTFRADGGGG